LKDGSLVDLLDSFVFEHTEREKKVYIEAEQQLFSKRTEHLLWHLLLRHRPQHVVFLLQVSVGGLDESNKKKENESLHNDCRSEGSIHRFLHKQSYLS
jgi:hypothetical protein